MLAIRRLRPEDHDGWLPLWHEYLGHYRTMLPVETVATTWRRLTATDGDPRMLGWGAWLDERLVGFAHVVTGPNTWSPSDDGYLEDLGVAAHVRGRGVGRALIAAITEHGRRENWRRVHWITEADNDRAQRLYDDVASRTTYVRYELAVAASDAEGDGSSDGEG